MRHRSNSRRSSLFCGAKIQSSRRPENRCRRRYAAGSQLRRMRLSGLSGPGRRAGQKRRYFVALLHGRRSRHDAKNRRVSGQSRCRTGTDGRRGALQRLVRQTPAYERLQRSTVVRRRSGAVRRRNGMRVRMPGQRGLCGGLSVRGHRRQPGNGPARSGRNQVHGLRRLRKSLSEEHHRTA